MQSPCGSQLLASRRSILSAGGGRGALARVQRRVRPLHLPSADGLLEGIVQPPAIRLHQPPKSFSKQHARLCSRGRLRTRGESSSTAAAAAPRSGTGPRLWGSTAAASAGRSTCNQPPQLQSSSRINLSPKVCDSHFGNFTCSACARLQHPGGSSGS